MLPEDIDDLFRDKLDGHETPPGDALWARLHAVPASEPSTGFTPDASSERLDQLFHKGLNAHATPPRRELWDRLEDEHLRPRKRRAAAWWPLAMVAAVALLIVAGGLGFWLGTPINNNSSGSVAIQQSGTETLKTSSQPGTVTNGVATADASDETLATTASKASAEGTKLAAITPSKNAQTASASEIKKNISTQATRSPDLASNAPKARMTASGQSPRHSLGSSRQPDAATDHRPLVARTTPRPAPSAKSLTAADERQPVPETTPVVASANIPKIPAPEIVPATAVPTPSVATNSEVITVDVRSGAAPARSARSISSALASASAEEAGEPRRLGGRLLQQAGHLVRGERVSLAEVTGLPENVTLRATVAGREITKSIKL